MKSRTAVWLVSAALIAGNAMAEDVKSAKEAPAKVLFPHSYGVLSLRQYEKVRVAKDAAGEDAYAGTTPYGQTRLTIGSTWFEGRLDTSATLFVQKETASTQLKTLTPELIAEYRPVTGEYGYVKPYVDMFPAFQGAVSFGDLGVENLAKLPLTTPVGKLVLSGAVDVSTRLVGGKQKVKVEGTPGDGALALTQDREGNSLTVQQDQSLNTRYNTKAALDIAALRGLSVYGQVEYFRVFNPKYAFAATEADNTRLAGYKADSWTETSADVSYKFNDTVSLSNTLLFSSVGFYQKDVNTTAAEVKGQSPDHQPSRWTNRLMLTANLF